MRPGPHGAGRGRSRGASVSGRPMVLSPGRWGGGALADRLGARSPAALGAKKVSKIQKACGGLSPKLASSADPSGRPLRLDPGNDREPWGALVWEPSRRDTWFYFRMGVLVAVRAGDEKKRNQTLAGR